MTRFRRLANRSAHAVLVGVSLLLMLSIGGCQTDQQVAADVKPETTCEFVAALLSSPSATVGQLSMAMEVGRNNGCFGQPQPQTVLVR
jgi:hypothetical protein